MHGVQLSGSQRGAEAAAAAAAAAGQHGLRTHPDQQRGHVPGPAWANVYSTALHCTAHTHALRLWGLSSLGLLCSKHGLRLLELLELCLDFLVSLQVLGNTPINACHLSNFQV